MPATGFMKPDGSIHVHPGDTVSGYCSKIYGVPPGRGKALKRETRIFLREAEEVDLCLYAAALADL